MLSDLGEIRKDEYMRKQSRWSKQGKTQPRHLERSPVIQSVAKNLLERSSFLVKKQLTEYRHLERSREIP